MKREEYIERAGELTAWFIQDMFWSRAAQIVYCNFLLCIMGYWFFTITSTWGLILAPFMGILTLKLINLLKRRR